MTLSDTRSLAQLHQEVAQLTRERAALLQTVSERERETAALKEHLRRLEKNVTGVKNELERQQSDGNEFIHELALNIAHQVRNPLGIIQASAEASLQNKWISKKETARQRAVLASVASLAKRLEEIMDFCRPLHLNRESWPVKRLLKEMSLLITGHCRARGIELIENLPDEGLVASADRKHVKIALLNILFNAIEAMPGGGRLAIGAAPRSSELAAVIIRDTGAGIRPEHRPMLGHPFFTTKPGGVGLGLAIAKRIIRAHQGELRIESIQGQGTAVELTLPAGVAEKT
ncbi:MAG: hypothetical protein HYT79_07880 [Elusimicrobia bacterium]|nr:hypothetical protein [Elusimicrobiota bacterium]